MITNILRRFSSTKVNCYTDRKDVIDLSPIEYSNKIIPDWFKQTPASFLTEERKSPTIKHCDGFKNIIQAGFVLRMWSDLKITVDEKGYNWIFADQESETEWHGSEQWNKFVDESKYFHIKIRSPYRFVCNDNTKFYCTPHELFYQENLRVMSGIVDFKIQHATHINCFVEKKNQEIIIPHGFPIYQFIPLTDKKVTISNKLVSTQDIKNLETPVVKFVGNYNYIKKCPFHKR